MLTSISLVFNQLLSLSRYDDDLVDYENNFSTLITFLSTLCRRQFQCYFHLEFLLFRFPAVMHLNPTSSRVDPGVQSGHETQFLFSEGDVRDSDADLIKQSALGKQFIPAFH